ncbi:uncharacterized protein isoform X2 [Musca autumnalis]|uniref:uncharacterized protein isoform X2 n=1 Tax=Musca autumnalis TaxID=221902 RepID=UPI003CF2F3CB
MASNQKRRQAPNSTQSSFWRTFFDLEIELKKELNKINKPPGYVGKDEEQSSTQCQASCSGQSNKIIIYNPLDYDAAKIHKDYLKRYLKGPKRVLFVTMNPASHGELQTGIPFGHMPTIREYMKLKSTIIDSPVPHPSEDEEQERENNSIYFWQMIREIFYSQNFFLSKFFQQRFVHSFCPLAFIDGEKQFVTLENLPDKTYRKEVTKACVHILEKQLKLLQPDMVIVMGGYVHGNMQRSKYCKTKLLPQIPNPWSMSQSMDTWKKNLKEFIMQHNVFPEIKQLWKQFYDLERELNVKLREFSFQLHTYNPVVHAAEIHCNYLQKYLDSPKRILFVGMNPGRYGALQTGIPFGNITTVKIGMGLKGRITPTPGQRGKIRIRGLEAPEVEHDSSSTRFWRLISELFDGAENYLDLLFEKCFVHNFCPLVFIDSDGLNVSLPYIEPNPRLFAECRKTLGKQITLLKPDLIICIGKFVRSMLSKTRQAKGREILMIEHPSYKNYISADKWIEDAKEVFQSNGLFWEIIRGRT